MRAIQLAIAISSVAVTSICTTAARAAIPHVAYESDDATGCLNNLTTAHSTEGGITIKARGNLAGCPKSALIFTIGGYQTGYGLWLNQTLGCRTATSCSLPTVVEKREGPRGFINYVDVEGCFFYKTPRQKCGFELATITTIRR